jgi:flagellar hook-basal body complex protein FliE
MTPINTSSLLAMRTAILEKNDALQRAAKAGQAGSVDSPADSKGVSGFGDALRSALAEVNSLQAQSANVAEAYEKGETTDIAAVMLSRQQASLGFEATLQVRNKLLAAYKDIMSMPV